jgi:hypothetical protein
MFFRREKPRAVTFDDRLDRLKQSGFSIERDGRRARVSKLGCAAILEGEGTELPRVGKAGVVVGNEIGYLVHGGYQSFFQTDSGRVVPALAEHLKALHDFQEDLREGLGLISLYNTSLGTTYNQHMYDRVVDRDVERPRKPWEVYLRKRGAEVPTAN